MTFDDHWADTQTRLRLYATNFGFIDEGDDEEGFRFVLDYSTTEHPAAMLGEIIADLNLRDHEAEIKLNLLVYFVAILKGDITISMPRIGLSFCSINAGQPKEVTGKHLDKERLWAKYQYDTEELILELFESKLNDCRRAHIRRVQ